MGISRTDLLALSLTASHPQARLRLATACASASRALAQPALAQPNSRESVGLSVGNSHGSRNDAGLVRPAKPEQRKSPRNPALCEQASASRDADKSRTAGCAIVGVSVRVPGLQMVNPLNSRQHWRAVSARGKGEKRAVWMALPPRHRASVSPPCVVTLTRVYGKRCRAFDSDATPAAMKHVRDAVAEWLGTDDGPKGGLTFRYSQERGESNSVVISVEPAAAKELRP